MKDCYRRASCPPSDDVGPIIIDADSEARYTTAVRVGPGETAFTPIPEVAPVTMALLPFKSCGETAITVLPAAASLNQYGRNLVN